jgi:hypothetical protein
VSYLNRFSQNVVASATNSSTANVNAGLSFVGTAVSTMGVAGIQVSLKTDQNATIYVEQSNALANGAGTVSTDGTITLAGSGTNFLSRRVGDEIYVSGETVRVIASIASDISLTVTSTFSTTASGLTYQMYNWDLSDLYNYYHAIGNFGITVQAISSYVRVSVTNTSATNTTYFRLGSILCPIVEAVPRTLDANGNLKVAIQSNIDRYGFKSEYSPSGEMRVTQVTRLAGSQFDTTLDSAFWVATVASSATAAVSGSELILTSNTNSAASAVVTSVRRARYVFAAYFN